MADDATPEPRPSGRVPSFAEQVDLSALRTLAVQESGRVKSFESFARGTMRYITRGRAINGQEDIFFYLDLMFRPQHYVEQDIVFVKQKQVRQLLSDALSAAGLIDQEWPAHFMKRGLISQRLLRMPPVVALLEKLEMDLIRTAKSVNEIRSALNLADARTLSFILRIVPPPDGDSQSAWLSVDRLEGVADFPQDAVHAGLGGGQIEGLGRDLQNSLSQAWLGLASAWQAQNATGVSTAAAELAALLPQVAPELYPDPARLNWESWYFRQKNLTWLWLIYLAAIIPLLMSVIYRWGWARAIGLGLFVIALGGHTFAVALRWHLAQRWPNSNMFEALTTAAWMGGVAALLLEVLVRKTALRNLFALGSAVVSMAGLMAVYYLPVTLSPQIGNMMPILHDVWLLIHTNFIIASYMLIAIASVTALLYLGYRVLGGNRLVAKAGGAGSLILADSAGSFLVPQKDPTTTGQVLDAATMILMEVAFIMLWTGLVMGAIWADHSWGRPWGWDPKEVFALNTFIVFLLLVHVRFKVRDKGLWTAVLAVVGCAVMLFNWIVVNFVITGLHSYA
ncbi:MAG: cytochrome c biogenesis protein CcsA [Planctomycetes bacterium]|nr:cytochrome c biogenesis protein CcsA [Planctomycetota bacterium]